MAGFSWTIQENASDLTITETTVTMTLAENTITIGGGGGGANLSYTASPTNGVVASDSGTDATLTLADGTNAGLMTPANFTKLGGIETGATADQSAAEILAALVTVDGTGSGLDADLLDGNHASAFATALGVDDNYVTDAEKVKLSNLSGTNTGDQDLSGLVPYTGAATDVELGTHHLNAASLNVKGTGGAGHIGLKHQSAPITAAASESSLGANSSGYPVWKNDGGAVEQIALESDLANKQPLDAQLTDIAGLTPTDNGVIIGNGANFVVESGATLKTSLGLTIGTDVQAYDADLTTIAGLSKTNDNFLQVKSGAWAERTVAQVTTDLQSTGLVADSVGFRNIPQNSKSAAYTTVAADSGKHLLHPASDANARTFTIDSNANVAYPIGTAITFINMSANVLTIAITSDTMYLIGAGTTGSRSLAQYGSATAVKIDTTTWVISGINLT